MKLNAKLGRNEIAMKLGWVGNEIKSQEKNEMRLGRQGN